ncbi:MAG: restriction endonuclease [Gomphosphaeria aponina SAG 52.96 = DSM 107014]|uniref:Restriction endonuclease n=1 Tax=Gomphosphaeria aponina SAG 52.96 = DSM 107014 TaxID=1521640 RepID=A0A941GW14_9CHRO|nr:restriction endonuclease [Gomphosphaeria aponina SAG 52.96 = DSM 107014]
MSREELNSSLEKFLKKYQESFRKKIFLEESLEEDDLMLVFGLTQLLKAENKQYWGRELGMCWQLLVTELCKQRCNNYSGSIKEGKDELCDLVVGEDAIDTKYRIGSGDSGTLKKFKSYGKRLKKLNLRPVLLIVRNDSLPQALKACETGGWVIKSGTNAYEYLSILTQFDLQGSIPIFFVVRASCSLL